MNKINEETEKKKRQNWALRHMFAGLPCQSRGENSMLPACCSQKQTVEKENTFDNNSTSGNKPPNQTSNIHGSF